MEQSVLIDRLRQLRARLADDGVTHLSMFGSRARGDHHDHSDLDVLIEVDETRKFSLIDLVGVQHTIGDEIGIPVQATMRRSLTPNFRETITRDIVEIF